VFNALLDGRSVRDKQNQVFRRNFKSGLAREIRSRAAHGASFNRDAAKLFVALQT
jgi:hypothetical protein